MSSTYSNILTFSTSCEIPSHMRHKIRFPKYDRWLSNFAYPIIQMSSSQIGTEKSLWPSSHLNSFYMLETDTCYILLPVTNVYLRIASKEKLGLTYLGGLNVRSDLRYNWMQVFNICKPDAISLLQQTFPLWLNTQVGLLHWTAEVPLEAQHSRF